MTSTGDATSRHDASMSRGAPRWAPPRPARGVDSTREPAKNNNNDKKEQIGCAVTVLAAGESSEASKAPPAARPREVSGSLAGSARPRYATE